jgi:hypothetical protein
MVGYSEEGGCGYKGQRGTFVVREQSRVMIVVVVIQVHMMDGGRHGTVHLLVLTIIYSCVRSGYWGNGVKGAQGLSVLLQLL